MASVHRRQGVLLLLGAVLLCLPCLAVGFRPNGPLPQSRSSARSLAAAGGRIGTGTAKHADDSASRWRRPLFSSSQRSPSASANTPHVEQPWTLERLEAFAADEGIELSLTTLGPGYRSVARASYDNSKILGYVEGFLRPAGQILHLDKMEAFQPMLKKVRSERPGRFQLGGITFGVGLLMGYRCLLHAKANGYTVAEFLAIDDEEFQHKRLVRYYRRVGFQVVRYVGENIRDVPDRMVWGGCGTLMREDIDVLMTKWSALLSKMEQNRTNQQA